MIVVTACHRGVQASPETWNAVCTARSKLSYHKSSHRQVVDDRGNSLPQRQRPDAFGIERHDDRIAGTDLRRLRTPEPTPALSRNDIAVRPHDVDTFSTRLRRGPAALGNVVVAGEPSLKYMRDGALYFTQDGDFLRLLRNEQLVAISAAHIPR